jgi:hypothetical protein
MAGSFLGGISSVPGAAAGGFTRVFVQGWVVDAVETYIRNRPMIGFLNNSNLLALLGLLPM